jgi:hypothetical protein
MSSLIPHERTHWLRNWATPNIITSRLETRGSEKQTMNTLFIAGFFLVAMIFAAVLVVAVLMLQQVLSKDSQQTGGQRAAS